MENEDQESPSPSPVPGPSRVYDDDLSLGGEAEPYQARDQDDDLSLAGPSYRYLSDNGASPAPSHSGLDADYDIMGVSQEASMSLSRQFDVFGGPGPSSGSGACSSSSSSSYIQSSYPMLPSTSSSRAPGSSDPVFSAHSQPIHNELLHYSQPGHSSDWDPSQELPMSSGWGVSDSDNVQSEAAELRPGPSDWDTDNVGSGLPGPSGQLSLEQAVSGQLSLDTEDQDGGEIQWNASSSSMDRRQLGFSEENSIDSDVRQNINPFPASIESSSFAPQPSSSSRSNIRSMNATNSISQIVPSNISLADMMAAGPSSSIPRSFTIDSPPQPEGSSSKRVLSSPDGPESNKRQRFDPTEPNPSNLPLEIVDTDHIEDIIVLDGPGPSVPNIPSSMASQINREIENCLKDDSYSSSRNSSIDCIPGPSRGFQSRVSFGNVASSIDSNIQQYSRGLASLRPQNFNEEQGPPSPTGSEVFAPGPSRSNNEINLEPIELHDSPSGSDVGAARSSHAPSLHENNPNSPAPSESDPDEAGPSNRGFMVRFGAVNDIHEREAAPVDRPISPVNRARSRRNLSDSCLISSSTGPVDSNPPTPEMFGVSGDIDDEYSASPPLRRYNYRYSNDDDEAVVDSTVDSTNIPFIINEYEGNEVGNYEDSDDDTESESVAGSEASSTTSARIDDHRLSLPGQDDNEGISTSGQVDVGQFRLVPNDGDISFDRRINSVPLPSAQFDIEEIVLDDPPSILQPPEAEQSDIVPVTFKKPFIKKDRNLDLSHNSFEPIPGPSGQQREQMSGSSGFRRDSQPEPSVFSAQSLQGPSVLSREPYPNPAVFTRDPLPGSSEVARSSFSEHSNTSRGPLQSTSNLPRKSMPVPSPPSREPLPGPSMHQRQALPGSSGLSREPIPGPSGLNHEPYHRSSSLQRNVPSPAKIHENQANANASIFHEESYTSNLNIGLAFSGLPSSVTLTKASKSNASDQKDNKEGGNDGPSGAPKKSLVTRHYQELDKVTQVSGEPQNARHDEVSVTPFSEILRSSLEGNAPGPSNGSINGSRTYSLLNNLSEAGPSGSNKNDDEPNEDEEMDEEENSQQIFTVAVEESNVFLSSIRSRKGQPPKTAGELKEYLPLSDCKQPQPFLQDMDVEQSDSSQIVDQELNVEPAIVTPPKTESITITISDQPVQSRAVASLPSNYLSLRPLDSGTAVIAVRNIPMSCRFGPMEGRLKDPGQDLNSSVPLALIINGQCLDVSSEEESNWMRFIRPAFSEMEQNLTLQESDGQLYFTTTREILANEELRVWYSEEYAQQHSLPRKPIEQSNGQNNILPPVTAKKSCLISPTVGANLAEKSRKDSDGPSYTCDICHRKFERQASLLRHLALHKGDKNFNCDICGQKFSHTFNLDRHKKKVHNADFMGQHVCCSVCSMWFPSNMVLKVHMFSHHPNKEEQNWTVEDAMAQSGKSSNEEGQEEMKFQCPSEGCECQYDTWLQLVEHAMEHGSQYPPNNDASRNQGPIHKCELCYKTFATDLRLKKHMAVHAGDDKKPLECTDCGKRFLTNSALAGHVKTHAHPDTLYDCPICGIEFEQVSSLKDHVYIHKVNGTFTCPHCEKTFNEYPQIRKHIRAFHAEKRFPCTVCDKGFTGRDKLKVHMLKHSESKDFPCETCGKEFKRKDKLKEHIKRMHTASQSKNDEQVNQKDEQQQQEQSPSKFLPKVYIF